VFCISMDGLSGTGFKDLSERVNDLVDQVISKVLGREGNPLRLSSTSLSTRSELPSLSRAYPSILGYSALASTQERLGGALSQGGHLNRWLFLDSLEDELLLEPWNQDADPLHRVRGRVQPLGVGSSHALSRAAHGRERPAQGQA
jgi:hypothetical protein